MSSRSGPAPLWARLMVVVGVLLMAASAVTAAGGRYLLARYTGSVHQENLLGAAVASPTPGHVSVDGAINLLLVGTDERPGPASSPRTRTG